MPSVKSHPTTCCDVERPSTWAKYNKQLCRDCRGTCCSMPVEVRVADLVRMELVHPFEVDLPAKQVAKRLRKAGTIDHFNVKHEIFTLARRANDDCIFLDERTRLCRIYAKRPATCRNHPQVGPRPGYCAFQQKTP